MPMIVPYVFIGIGIALICGGWFGKSGFLNDIEVPATEDEIQNAKPTPFKRIMIMAGGVAALIFGVMELFK